MKHTPPNIQDIAVFVAVAQTASFTRAGERLATSKSQVGKAIQRLEAHLGTKLFQRTTRAVRLTEDGETYLEAARAALDGLAAAEVALAARREEPVGHVRLDIAVSMGMVILPTLERLRATHPGITLELSLNDRQSDPVKDGWDIVVRIGELPDTGAMIVRKLCDLRLGLFASPRYLKARPAIRSIADLHEQDGILFRLNSGRLRPWLVNDGDDVTSLLPRTTIVSWDGRTMLDSIRAGLGIGQTFDRVAAPFVAAGELVPVLAELAAPGPPVHALIPPGRRMPPKIRAVLEHLSAVLGTGRSIGGQLKKTPTRPAGD